MGRQQSGRALLDRERRTRPHLPDAGERAGVVRQRLKRTTPSAAAIAADNAFIAASTRDRRTTRRSSSATARRRTRPTSASAVRRADAVLPLGPLQVRQRDHAQHGLQQAVRPHQRRRSSSASDFTVSANLNYIHDVTRRGITGNDNIGISPYNVFSYTPQFVNLNHRTPMALADQPVRTGESVCRRREIETPQEVSRFIGGGNINWTPWRTEHQSLQLTRSVVPTSRACTTCSTRRRRCRWSRDPDGLPGTSVSNVAQINYFNYSLNLIHHYTVCRGWTRRRRSGSSASGASCTNPVTSATTCSRGSMRRPSARCSTTSSTTPRSSTSRSMRRSRLCTLNTRLTADGRRHGRAVHERRRHQQVLLLSALLGVVPAPAVRGFLDELKLRAAYGQSGNLAPYGVKYTPFSHRPIDGSMNGVAEQPAARRSEHQARGRAETELGFDATMLNSRAQFSSTVYQKRLTNLLLQAGVAPSHGYSTLFENGGEFTNQGIELSLPGRRSSSATASRG